MEPPPDQQPVPELAPCRLGGGYLCMAMGETWALSIVQASHRASIRGEQTRLDTTGRL